MTDGFIDEEGTVWAPVAGCEVPAYFPLLDEDDLSEEAS